MKRCGFAKGKPVPFQGLKGIYLESKEFIIENYTKEEANEVFGDALDRVGSDCKKLSDRCGLVSKDRKAVSLVRPMRAEFVKEYSIIVNKPLKFDGYNVFQMDYRLDELKSMTFRLTEKETGKSYGEFTVDLTKPARTYELEDGAPLF